MSIKKLFDKQAYKSLENKNLEEIGAEVESPEYIQERAKQKNRIIPHTDFATASNFAFYGSAEQYYEDAFDRVLNTYPYDGSLKEKLIWHNSSSYIDEHIFDRRYPRTNGYIKFGTQVYGTSSATLGATDMPAAEYVLPSTSDLEYILLKGGPHVDNLWHVGDQRETNLKIDGDKGNTVEFWLKKKAWATGSHGANETIFDIHSTGSSPASASYNRLTVGLNGTASASPFRITYMSGTGGTAGGFGYQPIGQGITLASVADNAWHHYALTFENSGSAHVKAKLYVDGDLNDTIAAGVNKVSASAGSAALIATVGALAYPPSGTTSGFFHAAPTNANKKPGWAKLSGSLDELRFWKVKRTSKQIGRYWFTQVGGGANTDKTVSASLGVYYKFNEGITGVTATDQTVLDYSGRVSNGTWTGYVAAGRSTGSAMVEASAAATEFKDPIMHSNHSLVKTLKSDLKASGSIHDVRNNSSLYNSIPSWIVEETEETENRTLKKLTQVMGSYFDTLQLQIKALTEIKQNTYFSSSFKPLPFARNLVESQGMVAPEIFVDSDVIEQLASRDEDREYKEELYDVKNLIYHNIYNNLTHIYKSKGTEKSFRNLIRCFGVDDELIKINMYAENATYDLDDKYRETVVKKKYIDFNAGDRIGATVYQSTGSAASVAGAASHIQSSTNFKHFPITVEADVVFPKRIEQSDDRFYSSTFVSSSLFGMHTPMDPASTPQWASPDTANFQVYAAKDEASTSNRARFILTSSVNGFPTLSTDLYYNVYDNQRWNFAVRISPDSHPYAGTVDGAEPSHDGLPGSTNVGPHSYKVEFCGVNATTDTIHNEFFLSGTMPASASSAGENFGAAHKRLYLGAHRQDFTGSVLQHCDVKVSSLRYWLSKLENEEIRGHARDPLSYGTTYPYRNAYLFENPASSSVETYIPKIDTLLLHWDFSNVTGSDAAGSFTVQDVTSGSADSKARYGLLNDIYGQQYLGTGYSFPASSTQVVQREYLPAARIKPIESVDSSDMVTTLNRADQKIYTRNHRPLFHFLSFEKSMYQTISEEMLKMFSSIKAFNNLIGDPVNRYRMDYKNMAKLRQLFFDKVENTVDFDKYVEFYKWIDSALSVMLEQLIPASVNSSEGIRTIIESHVLERNKYHTKFPTIDKDPRDNIEASAVSHGAPNSPSNYSWRHGYAPLDGNREDNCLWWKERASRARSVIKSAAADPHNEHRENIKNIIAQHHSQSAAVFTKADGTTYTGSTYNRRRFSKIYDIKAQDSAYLHGGINHRRNKRADYVLRATDITANAMYVSASKINYPPKCNDWGDLNKKVDYEFGAHDETKTLDANGSLAAPFSLYSSSVGTGYNKIITDNFTASVDIANLHFDGITGEVPMQGPFTEQWVGGRQHRHVRLNFSSSGPNTPAGLNGLDHAGKRPEAWRIGFHTSIAATAVDAIDTTGVSAAGADCSVTITIPASAGGDTTGGAGAITILLDADQNTNPAEGANKIAIGIQFLPDDDIADRIIAAINGTANARVDFASSGRGQSGVSGITAAEGSSNTQITLTMDAAGDDGNVSSAVADVSGVSIIDTANFTGGETKKVFSFSHPGTHRPQARYSRDETAKRPLNIKNIQTVTASTTASVILGNYKNTYEVVQTSGRKINNLAFVADGGFAATATTNSSFISGTMDYTLVVRNPNKAVITERFAAPGGPDVSSNGVLDKAAGEYATHNALTFRNLSVRLPLKSLLTEHCSQFGIRSGSSANAATYEVDAAYHKINRNASTQYRIIGDEGASPTFETIKKYDNWYVQHQIPQSDLQYAWISASYSSTKQLGFHTGSDGITFVSASQVGSHIWPGGIGDRYLGADQGDDESGFLFTDFTDMNHHVYLAITSSLSGPSDNIYGTTTIEGHTDASTSWTFQGGYGMPSGGPDLIKLNIGGPARVLNTILLNRNGPYQHPTWKQIRTGDHPIARYHKRNNVISIIKPAPWNMLAYRDRKR